MWRQVRIAQSHPVHRRRNISAELSGSYNSAVLGKNLYEEEGEEKEIYVFNSRSASAGETLIALKIQECEEAGMSFEEVIQTTEQYIEEQHTYFVLENLETLIKRREGACCYGPQYQAGDGFHSGRNDLPEGAGKRNQEGAG